MAEIDATDCPLFGGFVYTDNLQFGRCIYSMNGVLCSGKSTALLSEESWSLPYGHIGTIGLDEGLSVWVFHVVARGKGKNGWHYHRE